MDTAFDISNVHFKYESKQDSLALAGVSLFIPTGSLFGLLGANGAGKTTLLKILSGFYSPTQGEFRVNEKEMNREELKNFGILLESPGIYKKLSVFEYLNFFGELYSVANRQRRIKNLLKEFSLELPNEKMGKLSLGNKQKVHLIRTLIHEPKFILWDEPFSHLDPKSQKIAINYIKNYIENKKATAIVATHQLEQAEEFVQQFCILSHGEVLFSGNKSDLKSNDADTVSIELEGEKEIKNFNWLQEAFDVDVLINQNQIKISGNYLVKKIPDIISQLCDNDYKIISVIPHTNKSLSELYHQIVK